MLLVRYVLPVLLLLVGVALFVLEPNSIGVEALAMGIGAALSLLLLNILFRVGVRGDEDRAREEAAREYYGRHGRWPDEED